jgi:hypothetical protein
LSSIIRNEWRVTTIIGHQSPASRPSPYGTPSAYPLSPPKKEIIHSSFTW